VPISIQVRSERQELIATLDDVSESLVKVPEPLIAGDLPQDCGRFPMLGYVDPVGDTVFNRRQADAVVEELQRWAGENPGDHSGVALARAVELLVAAHMRKPHTYLWFLGQLHCEQLLE
jgi:hypothetical protein